MAIRDYLDKYGLDFVTNGSFVSSDVLAHLHSGEEIMLCGCGSAVELGIVAGEALKRANRCGSIRLGSRH